MTFKKMQLEFQIRHYKWAKLRALEEVRDEFPHFWLFNGGLSWKFYSFLKMLTEDEQNLLVTSTLKRFHADAAAALGESVSRGENAIRERFIKFIMLPADIEREIAARRRTGDPMRFTSKRKVQRAMLTGFRKAFGHLGMQGDDNVGQHSSHVRMKYCGWVVQTNFSFGRSRAQIRHTHSIFSEDVILHPITPGVTGPALLLANALCWINLSVMEWEYLTDTDIEPACDSVIELCREFFDELPKLLKGLERENIAPD
jgi:hypothetical protein